MAKIEFEDVSHVIVHWSESKLVNDELGHDDNFDINKRVDRDVMDDLVKRAAPLFGGGYDKTMMSVFKTDGSCWADECKFYMNKSTPDLITLLNKGE